MADIDPMVREALKRTSHLQGNNHTHNNNRSSTPTVADNKYTPNHTTENHMTQRPPGALDFLLKDKEQSLIMLLIVLLMNEDTDPSLTLALLYLLL